MIYLESDIMIDVLAIRKKGHRHTKQRLTEVIY